MYSFVSSLLREKGINKPYQNVNIANVKLADIYATYNDGFIELSNPSLKTNTYVSLNDLKSAANLAYVNLPFASWLAVQGNATIFGSTNVKPTVKNEVVHFSDAIQADFKLRMVRPNDPFSTNTYPKDMLTDIYAIKNVGDPSVLHKRVLTTVNGLLHLNIPAGNGLLIKDGGKSFMIEQDNLVGVLTFERIGDIEQIPITDEMIKESSVGKEYRKAVYLNIDRNLVNKTVMISFAGRLFTTDGLLEVINAEGGLRFNTYKLDIYRIVQDLIGKIDLKTLNLDLREYYGKSFTPESVIDDETMLALLKLMQTFIIVVDTPNLLTATECMMYPNTPGYFETYENTKLPYIDDFGVMHPYWKVIHLQELQNVHRMHLKNTVYVNPLQETTGYRDPENMYRDQYQYHPRVEYHLGRLLKIFSEELIVE